MRYDVALSIGTKVEGVIKCTWAELFDENGKKIFSLQNRNFHSDTIIPYMLEIYNKDKDASMWATNQNVNKGDFFLNLNWTRAGIFEAVVQATDYVYDYKVPVRLTQAAIDGMVRILQANNSGYFIRYHIPADWDSEKGDYVWKESMLLPGAAQAKRHVERNNALIKALPNMTVYVKPKAFEWYPLNTYRLQGQDVEEARKRYEKSKKLLAASAATIIL